MTTQFGHSRRVKQEHTILTNLVLTLRSKWSCSVADVGGSLDRWVFKVGDADGQPLSSIGSVLQPQKLGGSSEGNVTLGAWTELPNGLRSPNYSSQMELLHSFLRVSRHPSRYGTSRSY